MKSEIGEIVYSLFKDKENEIPLSGRERIKLQKQLSYLKSQTFQIDPISLEYFDKYKIINPIPYEIEIMGWSWDSYKEYYFSSDKQNPFL